MPTFEERKHAHLNKYARDQETQFKIEMRRNKLLGLWAAGHIGLSGDAAEEYAKTVVVSDMEEAGDEDVFRKVIGDFEGNGVTVGEDEIRDKMISFLDEAAEQI